MRALDLINKDVVEFASTFKLKKELEGSRFLITGATGLIGSTLVRCLIGLNNGIRITCPVRNIEKTHDILGKSTSEVNFIECDLINYLQTMHDDFEYIVHCASPTNGKYMTEHPVETYEIAVETTRLLLNYASAHKKTGMIYVGSAGTAARFLSAMCGLSDGVYEIQASSQMEKRPMRPLFEALEQIGANITYLKEPYYLPVIIEGAGKRKKGPWAVSLDISKSTQFLSAFLMTGVMCKEGLKLKITSEKKTGSYIKITMNMMEDFGVKTKFDGEEYAVEAGAGYKSKKYQIEPDVSAACYFWAMAALTNGCVTVKNVHKNSMQGDMMFLEVLEQMGCKVSDTGEGIQVKGTSRLKGVKVDMNNFSDQALTLAALAVFADGPSRIEHIGHIRLQESDRLNAIATELGRMGVRTEEEEDAITIYPGKVNPAVIKTYEDHRVAMAFSLIGLKTEGIVIDDPMCCKKTFEEYFFILDNLTK